MTLTVRISAAQSTALTLTWQLDAVTSGTAATYGVDFTGPSSGTVTIAAGATTATVSFSVVGDANLEADENFVIRILPNASVNLRDAYGVVTVKTDDSAPKGASASAQSTVPPPNSPPALPALTAASTAGGWTFTTTGLDTTKSYVVQVICTVNGALFYSATLTMLVAAGGTGTTLAINSARGDCVATLKIVDQVNPPQTLSSTSFTAV